MFESLYQEVWRLTQEMLEAARAQAWDHLVSLGEARDAAFAKIPAALPRLSQEEGQRIAEIIAEIEVKNAEMLERVETWREHVKILLRLNKPEPSPV